MADVTTTPSGTSITYPPMSGGGNSNQAVWRAEEFLAFLLNQNNMNEGFHHILAREAQIQTDIASAEGAVQSAISAAQNAVSNNLNQTGAALSSQASTYALGNANTQSQYALSQANQTANVQLQAATNYGNIQNDIATARENINLQVRDVNATVNAGTLMNAQNFGNLSTQTAQQTGVITNAITADGEKTRAILTAQYENTLNRQLLAAQNEITELRGDRAGILRAHGTEVTVSQNVAQAQQQQQQQATLGAILARLEGLVQVAHATNQNVIAGNTGAVSTGPQNANPTNVGRL